MANTAAVMTGLNRIELQDRPVPEPGPGQAVVRVEAVGVCGSDVAYYRYGKIGPFVVEGDFILGHEVSGQVVAVGVANVAEGDRVAVEPGTPDRSCAEYLAGPGDDVLVTGAGPVGLLAAESARALGAGSVTLTDVSDYRLDVARSHGFAAEKSDAPTQRTFDVLLERSGAGGVLAAALGRLREAGRAAVIGLAKADTVPLPLSTLNWKEFTISMVNRYNSTWPTAIALVSSGRISLDGLATHQFSLAQTAAALDNTSTEPKSLKAMIYPQRT